MPKLDSLWYEIEARTSGFDEGILKSGEKLKAFTDYAKGAPIAVLGALGAAAVVAAYKIEKMGEAWDYELRKLNTVLQVSDRELAGFSKQMLDLFRDVPVQDVNELSDAFYQVASAGIEAGKVGDVVRASATLAVGGFTDVGTVADVVTTVLNSYKDSALDAARATDVMAQGVAAGKLTVAELSQHLGQIVPIASAAGVSLDEVVAVLAQLSLSGVKAAEGATQLRSAISNILSPNDAFAQQFPELAKSFDATRLARDGFIKFLADFQRESKGSRQALLELFSDINARQLVLKAAADDGRGLAEMLERIHSAAGQTQAQFDVMANASKNLGQAIRNELTAALIESSDSLVMIGNRWRLLKLQILDPARAEALKQRTIIAGLIQDPLGTGASDLFARDTPLDQPTDNLDAALRLFKEKNASILNGLNVGQLKQIEASLTGIAKSARGVTPEFQAFRRAVESLREELERYDARQAKVKSEIDKLTQPIRDAEIAQQRKLADAQKNQAMDTKAEPDRERIIADARDAIVRTTTTLVDDLELQLAEQEKRIVEAFTKFKHAVPEDVKRAMDGLRAQIAAQRIFEDLTTAFDQLEPQLEHAASMSGRGFSGGAFTEALPRLETLMARTREQLAATKEGTPEHERLVKLLAREEELWSQIAEHAADLGAATRDTSKDEKQRIRDLQEQARNIEAAARGALQLASAFGLVSEEAGRALESIAQIAANIQGALAGDLTSILGVSGGVAALGQALLGSDPEAKRREREHQEVVRKNTEAIQRLTRQVGEFGITNLSGQILVGLDAAIAKALTTPKARGTVGAVTDDRFVERALNNALDAAKLTWKELEQAASDFGITIDKSHLRESLEALAAAMKDAEIAQFGKTYAGQLQAINAEFELFDITDPIKQLQDLVDVFNNPNVGAPALREALAGLDLTTPEGQAKAKEAVQALFRQLQTGTLTAADLGGLSAGEFLDALEQVKRLLDSGAAPGTGGYNIDRSITEATGSLIGGLLTTSNVWLQRITAATETMAQALAGSIQPLPTLYPPTVTTSTGGGALGAAPVFNLTVNVTIAPGASVADARGAGEEIGKRTLDAINAGLGEELRRRKQLFGEVTFS